MRVIVVGAGVLGLTCALRLAERSWDVHVLARDLPLETASARGALLWHPPPPGAADREVRWAQQGRAWLESLGERAGVRLLDGLSVTATASTRSRVPVGDPAVHLPWLRAQVESRGATLTRSSLGALPVHAAVVVNASGVAARSLAADPGVEPVSEQVVLLDASVREWVLDRSRADSPLLVAPSGRLTVVGSVLRRGSFQTEPDPRAGEVLLERAARVLPALTGAPVRGHRVQVRAWRAAPRVQAEDVEGRRVVHCYGHGDGGWSQAWGCAGEVERLVAEAAR